MCGLAAALAILYVAFWWSFVRALSTLHPPAADEPAPIRHLDPSAARHLGRMLTARPSSFVNFSRTRDPAVFRVCAFGGSFTYGDEAAPGHEYPALLQSLLQRRGIGEVEVLNFGSTWFGFHQSYLVWQLAGREFECAVVLLGPRNFWPEWDTTFNHTRLAYPYYFHSRFVLEDGDLRLVDVPGRTPSEQFRYYYSFVPRWRTLRYDRNPPAVIRAIVGRDRRPPNPFYYHPGTAEAEALETYRILFGRFAEADARIVLVSESARVRALADGLQRANLASVDDPVPERFPYLTPGRHYSAFGNELLAQQFMTRIPGIDPGAVTRVETFDLPATPERHDGREPARLSSYRNLGFTVGGRPAGAFVRVTRSGTTLQRPSHTLQAAGVDSLVGLRNGALGLVDACFIPVPWAGSRSATGIVRLRAGDEEQVLGTARRLDPRVPIGFLDVAGFDFDVSGELSFAADHLAESGRWRPDGRQVELMLDDVVIARGSGSRRGRIQLHPTADSYWRVRTIEGQFVPVHELAASGTVDLVLDPSESNGLRIPFAGWRTATAAAPR